MTEIQKGLRERVIMSRSLLFNIIITCAIVCCIGNISYCQDSIKPKKIIFNGYVKELQTALFQDIHKDWVMSNLLHNRLNLKWLISPSFTASVEVRNRFVYGNMLSEFPGYNTTFDTDNGVVALTKNLVDEKFFVLNTAIDRLWIQYSAKKFQVTLGRQRINWGQTFIWNPNDIFNSYSYFDFDYEERPGSDALRLQYYPGPASTLELAAKVNRQKKVTAAALYRFNKWNFDFQFLGGIADHKDIVIGTGWSGQILKGGFRGEATYFHPVTSFSDTAGVFLGSVGYDYTLKNSVFLQFEILYNGNPDTAGLFSLTGLNNSNVGAKQLFLPDFSVFFSVSYPFTPLFSGSLAGIANFRNNMVFIIPTLNVSLKENLELILTSQIMQYYSGRFSKNDLYLFFARLKWSF